MSNHDFDKPSFDDAIDNAVRGIIQLDPRPGLRRRVLSQLDAPSAARSWTPRIIVPLGALVCIALATVVLTREPRVTVVAPASGLSTAPDVAAATVPPSAAGAATVVAATAPAIGETSRVMTGSARPRGSRVPARQSSASIFGPRRDRVAAASVDSSGRSIEAAIAPDGFNPLPALVLPALIIEPLNLEALPGRIRKTP